MCVDAALSPRAKIVPSRTAVWCVPRSCPAAVAAAGRIWSILSTRRRVLSSVSAALDRSCVGDESQCSVSSPPSK